MLVLTNSYVAESPILLTNLVTATVKNALVTLPVGKGELKAADFAIAGGPQFRYQLSVETADGLQTLYAKNFNPETKDETTGYVVLTNGDTDTSCSYRTAGFWKNGLRPQPDLDYYTNGKLLRDKGGSEGPTFNGRSLTQKGMFRLYNGTSTYTISDWRVLSSGSSAIGSYSMLTTMGGSGRIAFEGMMTVFSTANSPFCLYGGLTTFNDDGSIKSQQTYEMRMKVRGASDAVLSVDGATSRAPGEAIGMVAAEFLGDMSEFYGKLMVGTNETVRLGNWGLTNGTLEARTSYSTITTKADEGRTVPVRRFVSQTSTRFDIPASSTLAITDGASITGTLTKDGAGTLAVGGTATAGAGARIAVNAGALETLSSTALAGVGVDFAAGTGGVVKWDGENGLDLSGSDVTVAGDTFAIAFDVSGATIDPKGRYIKKILTVKSADADKFTGKISVVQVPGLPKPVLLDPVTEGGFTTYSVQFARQGLLIVVR